MGLIITPVIDVLILKNCDQLWCEFYFKALIKLYVNYENRPRNIDISCGSSYEYVLYLVSIANNSKASFFLVNIIDNNTFLLSFSN